MILGLSLVFGLQYWGAYTHPFDPIGDASDPDWDRTRCHSEERFTRFNGAGKVAAFRESVCENFGGAFSSPTVRYYVFVKGLREDSNRQNLVFRMKDAAEGPPPPVVTWLSPSRLRISYAGPLSNVDKRVTEIHGVGIQPVGSQPYAGLSYQRSDIVFYPQWYTSAIMTTFDLLSLPNSPPPKPFAATGDFSADGCDPEARNISDPVRLELNRVTQRLEIVKKRTGAYPRNAATVHVRGLLYLGNTAKLVPSPAAPVVQIIYHGIGSGYALDLEFPDLEPRYHQPTAHFDSSPADEFVSCTAVHFGTIEEITNKGGFILPSHYGAPILFTPSLGVHTY